MNYKTNQQYLWNWQQKSWPHFTYHPKEIDKLEQIFLEQAGVSLGLSKHTSLDEQKSITIDLMCNEALNTSEIEGEILNRASLQSLIKKVFGLKTKTLFKNQAEEGIAKMMFDVYQNYQKPLTHKILCNWHKLLMQGKNIQEIAKYRTHQEAMQIVSGYIHKPTIHFEAPPSKLVKNEMNGFIAWFNETAPGGKKPLPPLIRSAIAHLYFISIHPFEDGNGRIARALVEKTLAQQLKRPTLIGLSYVINKKRKKYYAALGKQNKNNDITAWIIYFSNTILEAQQYTIDEIEFLIKKTKFFDKHKDLLNPRQLKVVKRILREGLSGFTGSLSASNYIAITKTSASTATRDLHDLVSKKIFKQTGLLKSARYWLKI